MTCLQPLQEVLSDLGHLPLQQQSIFIAVIRHPPPPASNPISTSSAESQQEMPYSHCKTACVPQLWSTLLPQRHCCDCSRQGPAAPQTLAQGSCHTKSVPQHRKETLSLFSSSPFNPIFYPSQAHLQLQGFLTFLGGLLRKKLLELNSLHIPSFAKSLLCHSACTGWESLFLSTFAPVTFYTAE